MSLNSDFQHSDGSDGDSVCTVIDTSTADDDIGTSNSSRLVCKVKLRGLSIPCCNYYCIVARIPFESHKSNIDHKNMSKNQCFY